MGWRDASSWLIYAAIKFATQAFVLALVSRVSAISRELANVSVQSLRCTACESLPRNLRPFRSVATPAPRGTGDTCDPSLAELCKHAYEYDYDELYGHWNHKFPDPPRYRRSPDSRVFSVSAAAAAILFNLWKYSATYSRITIWVYATLCEWQKCNII